MKVSDNSKKINIMRLGLIGLLVFFIAGGISLSFLIYLGAAAFEIDPTLSGLPVALSYPVFCLIVYLPYLLFPAQDPMIKVFPFSKKEETLQFAVEIGFCVIGAIVLAVASSNPEKREMISMFGFSIFYFPGICFRGIVLILKSREDPKALLYIGLVFTGLVILPAIISFAGFAIGNVRFVYFALLYPLALITLLSVGHKEDDLEPEPSSEASEQEQAN